MPVAPEITQGFDDIAPRVGTILFGEYTNDASPRIRVSLGDQATVGDHLYLKDNGVAIGPSATLMAGDLARGYVDIQLSHLGPDWHPLIPVLTASDGAVKAQGHLWAVGIATGTPATPAITGALDDQGPHTGPVANGGHTDDTTPTISIFEPGLPPRPTTSPGHPPYGGSALFGATVELREDDHVVGTATMGYDGVVAITPAALKPGDHEFTAVIIDRAGNPSHASTPFHIVIGPDGAPAGGPGQSGSDEDVDHNYADALARLGSLMPALPQLSDLFATPDPIAAWRAPAALAENVFDTSALQALGQQFGGMAWLFQ